ncbi:MAG: hypothetical protein FWG34_14900 [Oscillospiraceae bacterium]|nr:hypothetical protein [Oscillospiraceae bacterium]
METKIAYRIAYSQSKTNLKGGKWANVATTKSYIVNMADDGATQEPFEIASEYKYENGREWSVQFAGWDSDSEIRFYRAWTEQEHAQKEEEKKSFIFDNDKKILHTWKYNLDTGEAADITEIEKVSDYCTGFYRSGDKYIFSAMIGQNQVPYVCELDYTNKRPLFDKTLAYTYMPTVSEDGITIRQTDYKVYIEYPDGTTKYLDTKQNFNFAPVRSPDGKYLTFIAGQTNETADGVYVADISGDNLTKITTRGGYIGAILTLDVPDHHKGSSDVPVWSPCKNQHLIYFTKKDNENGANIYQIDMDTGIESKITDTGDGTLNYHPTPSPDGKWLSFGSNRSGTRQLYVMRADGGELKQISKAPEFHGAMHVNWHLMAGQ